MLEEMRNNLIAFAVIYGILQLIPNPSWEWIIAIEKWLQGSLKVTDLLFSFGVALWFAEQYTITRKSK